MTAAGRTTQRSGVVYALGAAVLFGANTPVAKLLLDAVDPMLLAGLLYCGSGCGLGLWAWIQSRTRAAPAQEARLRRADLPWLAGAILAGGVVAPVLLMFGLAATA